MNEAGNESTPTDSQHALSEQLIREVDGVELPERPEKKLGTSEVIGVVVGRDRQVVPPHEVFKLASIGCKDTEIADWFGIKKDTLAYNFATELIKGRETMKQSLRRKMLETAMSGNAVMQIFLSKNFLGMSDNPQAENNTAPLPWTD
jgi:hypothetical protein